MPYNHEVVVQILAILAGLLIVVRVYLASKDISEINWRRRWTLGHCSVLQVILYQIGDSERMLFLIPLMLSMSDFVT